MRGLSWLVTSLQGELLYLILIGVATDLATVNSFFSALKAFPQEVLNRIYEQIIDIPATGPTTQHTRGRSAFIPHPASVYNKPDYIFPKDEGGGIYSKGPFPMPIHELFFPTKPNANLPIEALMQNK